jgi:hypothetical protein
MEGSSGSVVLLQPHTDFSMEEAEQRKQAMTQRLEMAENAAKRTRHPFSGYIEILRRERTTPQKKMVYKGKPSYKMAQSMSERDQVMGGYMDRNPEQNQQIDRAHQQNFFANNRPPPRQQPQFDPNQQMQIRVPQEEDVQDEEPMGPRPEEERQQILNMVEDVVPGFQPPRQDPNTGEWVYHTLNVNGQEMFERWLEFIRPEDKQFIRNHPDKVNIFHQYLEDKRMQDLEAYNQLLEILRGRRQNPNQWAYNLD